MKNITTSCFTFRDVIESGYVYVDKTDQLARLASVPKGQFFISRPRRFGKSLMLSTLKCLFEGRRELFKGLKVERTDYDWKTYPVLHLDMDSARAETMESIATGLNGIVLRLADQLGLSIVRDPSPGMTFERLWEQIAKRGLQVVVLVDEYDVPLQGFLKDREKFEVLRQMMHDFYVRLKAYSGNIRFLMLTGVTKLAKLSVFSGLNNLTDLTMHADYAGLLGYTHDELETFFSEHIDAFAAAENTTHSAIVAQLLDWYDNYRFSPRSDVRVLNPVSVGNALAEKWIKSNWVSTGRATMILEHLRDAGELPSDLDSIVVYPVDLDVCDVRTMPLPALLYQGGYLTIKDVTPVGALRLGVPNAEVRDALVYDYLATEISETTAVRSNQRYAVLHLREGNLAAAIECFRAAIAALPHEWVTQGKEAAVKTAFALFFYAMNDTHVTYERETANGRADAIVETKTAVYVFEFKYGKTARKAFDQIVEKGYAVPYLASGRPVWGIGLNFNPRRKTRGVDEPVVARLDRDVVPLPVAGRLERTARVKGRTLQTSP